jgi:metal-responsive CopG/Arc/MetJ family transcriptional regulator
MRASAIANSEPARLERVVVGLPRNVADMVDQAARKNFQTRSEFMRQSVVERLRADGVLVEQQQKGA